MLESRSLMTGGAGSIFALVPGTVDAAGAVGSHAFTLDRDHFTIPTRHAVLGIDVAASGASSIKPKISSVALPSGRALAITYPRGGVLKGANTGSNVTVTNGAVLVPLRPLSDHPVTYTTHVLGESNTTGNYILGYYLPGDADGNGKVEQADLSIVRKAIGSIVGDSDYVFDADTNRDGRVGLNDLQVAQRNLGLATTVSPVVSANLDPISDSGVPDRITVFQDVILTGTGTPGATITYSEVDKKTPDVSTTVRPDGTYDVTARLAEGKNTFHVSYVDPFGQVISGTIAAIEYQRPAVPVESPTKPAPATPDPAPTPNVEPTNVPPRYAQLVARFPGWFQKNPDQAAKLREMLSK
jgi:hypothetical protein